MANSQSTKSQTVENIMALADEYAKAAEETGYIRPTRQALRAAIEQALKMEQLNYAGCMDDLQEAECKLSARVPSSTSNMNMAQRILHVGGHNNAAGYVEFGSIQAVEALVRQVLRDLPESDELVRLRADVNTYREATALMLAASPQHKQEPEIRPITADPHKANKAFLNSLDNGNFERETGISVYRLGTEQAPQPKQEPGLHGATHRQPITGGLYKQIGGVWYVWSRIENEPKSWIKSPGTHESCLEKIGTTPQPPQKRPQNCGTGFCSCIECPHCGKPATHEQKPVKDRLDFWALIDENQRLRAELKFNTTPQPQREWVGLTEEEKDEFVGHICDYGTGFVAPLFATIDSIEAKLREKNKALQQNEALRRELRIAVAIIQNEYPEEQWPDYRVPEMLAALKEQPHDQPKPD
jgi:hypothetical protein